MRIIFSSWIPISILVFEMIIMFSFSDQKSQEAANFEYSEDIRYDSIENDLTEGYFFLRVDKPLNTVILVRYAIPRDEETGKILDSANKMVFYSPFCGDDVRIVKGLLPWHKAFAEEYGYSVFTFTVRTTPEYILSDDYYVHSRNGWPEIVFEIKNILQNKFGLSDMPLIIIGESSGGSFAQQILATYPDKVECAAWNGGRIYKDFNAPTNCRIMATNVWGCPGTKSTEQLCLQSAKKGIIIENYSMPPNIALKGRKFEHHAAWTLNYELITDFVVGNDYKHIVAKIPERDFADRKSYIFFTPDKPSKMVVLIVYLITGDSNAELKLKDNLWYLYNDGILPAYINCRLLDKDEKGKLIDEMKKYADKMDLQCIFRELSFSQ